MAAGQIRTMSVAAPVLKEKIGPVEVHGRLIEAGIGDGQQRYILDNLSIRGVATAETPLRARITVHVPSGNTPDGAPSHLVPGDYIASRRRCSRHLSQLRPVLGILAGNPGFKASVQSDSLTARRNFSRMPEGHRAAAYLFGCARRTASDISAHRCRSGRPRRRACNGPADRRPERNSEIYLRQHAGIGAGASSSQFRTPYRTDCGHHICDCSYGAGCDRAFSIALSDKEVGSADGPSWLTVLFASVRRQHTDPTRIHDD